MHTSYDEFDDFEFDDRTHQMMRGLARQSRHKPKSRGLRRLTKKRAREWVDPEWSDLDNIDAYDYLEFDHYDDEALNRWR